MKREAIRARPIDDARLARSQPAPRPAIGQYVHGFSHDFRTPLTVIHELASNMREGLSGPVTDKQLEHLAVIMARVDELALSVDDLLDASAIEAGSLGLWRRPAQPSEIFARVRLAIERQAAARRIALEIAPDESLPAIYCDVEKVGRAIVTLAGYALKHTPAGGCVRFSARRHADGRDAVFEFSDVVSGLAAGDATRKREPSRQFSGADAQGQNLGLNVACQLVRFNLGAVRLFGEGGCAAEFSLTLPAAEALPYFERYLDLILDDAVGSPQRGVPVSLVAAETDSCREANLLSAVDGFVQTSVGGYDLAYRLDDQHWILAVLREPAELDALVQQIERDWVEFGRNGLAGEPPALRLELLGSWPAKRRRAALVRAFANVAKRFAP